MPLKTIRHRVQLCVVGGGLAGMGVAVAAARHGIETLLMHERPMPGGNASSEVRMWVCGCPRLLETGLIEELRLENRFRNPDGNYSVWDTLTYEMVARQDHLTTLFNCSCFDAVMEKERIVSVRGWQMTTQQFHEVEAELFADCSGDSILAPLTGAAFRAGREAKNEFGETLGRENADARTMGMSCILQARQTNSPRRFIPPEWAARYPDEQSFPARDHTLDRLQNFWWVELGGMGDSIADTESLRDELLKTMLCVWDHIKNRGDHAARNWALDWLGFLPGKRESRRYVGDYIVRQEDILSGGGFPDAIAYGGWPVDDHHPAGILHRGEANTNILPLKPYTLPLRSLYSCNIANLLFAGRNISVSHVALSSTRVMATCMLLGQAAGTLAATALTHGESLRETALNRFREVQRTLLDDDCTIPGLSREIPEAIRGAKLTASTENVEQLRSGIDRDTTPWFGKAGDFAEYDFGEVRDIRRVRIVFDSDLQGRLRNFGHLNLPAQYLIDMPEIAPPETLMKNFSILADGREILRVSNGHQRFVSQRCSFRARTVRFLPGDPEPRGMFAFELQ